MDFAVGVPGVTEEGQALWVLAVDPIGERVLVGYGDGSLHWHPTADCTFAKAVNPEAPRMVIPVQPQQPIVLPNRVQRRALARNGNE